MSQLRIESLVMPAADLGPENPMPPLLAPRNASTETLKVSWEGSADEARMDAYRTRISALPHRLQDGFNRVRRQRAFRVAVLENEFLRATFLLEMGGRLWSLIHKPTGRELLYVNPIFQPANLSIRTAWFSGGVEWNCGIIGHSVYTCSPLHAAKVLTADGTPVLRLYEWDRLRGTPYQIDFYLPDGMAFLLARVRIINPHDFDVPMYWWSNIAVPELDGQRVIMPAGNLYKHVYGKPGIHKRKVHEPDDKFDMTYTVNHTSGAGDGYFAMDANQWPWMATIDSAGAGLVHASTNRLRGRKMFYWGRGSGGMHWQDFLSVPGNPYIEIQAGLATTQADYVAMPAKEQWCWLEAYGLAQVPPAEAHAKDYATACRAVETELSRSLSAQWMEAELTRTEAMADTPPSEIIQRGSPWGALECRRRAAAGLPASFAPGLVFDAAGLSEESAQWQALLDTGTLPARSPNEDPGAYMTQPEWLDLLEKSVAAGKGDNWFCWYHLGVMYYNAARMDRAKAAWEKSISYAPSAWAMRNLASLARLRESFDESADLYMQASRIMPNSWQLAAECCEAILRAGRPQATLEFMDELPAAVTGRPRLQVIRARAYMDLEEFAAVEKILTEIELTDVREGEVSLNELWFNLKEKQVSKAQGIPIDDALSQRVRSEFPLPQHLDFRTHGN